MKIKNKFISRQAFFIYLISLIALAVVFFSFLLINKLYWKSSSVIVDNKIIDVQLALTGSQQAIGLSNHKNLCLECGMLFVFPQKEIKKFWMKDMDFPIDIIWLNDNKVVGITSNLPVPKNGEQPVTATSTGPVNYVLELNAGMADYYGFKENQEITYNLFIK